MLIDFLRRRSLITASVALALGVGGRFTNAAAEDTASSATTLEEVVVTAQKRPERIHEVPIPASIPAT